MHKKLSFLTLSTFLTLGGLPSLDCSAMQGVGAGAAGAPAPAPVPAAAAAAAAAVVRHPIALFIASTNHEIVAEEADWRRDYDVKAVFKLDKPRLYRVAGVPLVITAHGCPLGIGNSDGSILFTPERLAEILYHYVLDPRYPGQQEILLSVCEGAALTSDLASHRAAFAHELGKALQNIRAKAGLGIDLVIYASIRGVGVGRTEVATTPYRFRFWQRPPAGAAAGAGAGAGAAAEERKTP